MLVWVCAAIWERYTKENDSRNVRFEKEAERENGKKKGNTSIGWKDLPNRGVECLVVEWWVGDRLDRHPRRRDGVKKIWTLKKKGLDGRRKWIRTFMWRTLKKCNKKGEGQGCRSYVTQRRLAPLESQGALRKKETVGRAECWELRYNAEFGGRAHVQTTSFNKGSEKRSLSQVHASLAARMKNDERIHARKTGQEANSNLRSVLQSSLPLTRSGSIQRKG